MVADWRVSRSIGEARTEVRRAAKVRRVLGVNILADGNDCLFVGAG